jgi:RNA polymerase sigma-70 factor, ECF subfamily
VINISIDRAIVDGCLKRQPQAQEALYRACYPVFMKICLRYTDSYDDAANVLQDAFIKIFMKIETYTGSGDIVGWMRRIVVNSAIDYTRKEKNNALVSMPDVPDRIDFEEKDESKYVIDEKQLLVLIRELPKMQSLVFNLFVMEDYSHQEIADQLSITLALSKWYLFDARKMLQKKLAVYVND